MPKRQLKRTTVDITDLLRGQDEALSEIDFALIEAQGQSREAIRLQRQAAIAQANAQMATQRAQAAYMKVIMLAAEHSNTVAEEEVWMKPYRNSDGHIILETIFTQRDARVAARIAHKQLQTQANSEEFNDLFDEESDEDRDR